MSKIRPTYCVEVSWLGTPLSLLETRSLHAACNFLKTINFDEFGDGLSVRFFRHHPFHVFDVHDVLEVLKNE